jgi:hypothetical protein
MFLTGATNRQPTRGTQEEGQLRENKFVRMRGREHCPMQHCFLYVSGMSAARGYCGCEERRGTHQNFPRQETLLRWRINSSPTEVCRSVLSLQLIAHSAEQRFRGLCRIGPSFAYSSEQLQEVAVIVTPQPLGSWYVQLSAILPLETVERGPSSQQSPIIVFRNPVVSI